MHVKHYKILKPGFVIAGKKVTKDRLGEIVELDADDMYNKAIEKLKFIKETRKPKAKKQASKDA